MLDDEGAAWLQVVDGDRRVPDVVVDVAVDGLAVAEADAAAAAAVASS